MVEVIPSTTFLGPVMATHLMVVMVTHECLTQEVEVKIPLSSLMLRNWMARTSLNGPKQFDLF
jgi:hypothetical protein